MPVDSSPSPIDQQPSVPASPPSPSTPPVTPSSPATPPKAVTTSAIEHIASTTSTLPSHTFNPAGQIGDSGSSSGSSNPGAIAGGIIGGLAGIAILGGIFFLCLRKKPIAKGSTDMPQQTSPQTASMPMTGAGTSAAGAAAMNPFNDPEKQLPPPPQPQVVGFHAWNAASSSDMLASSAAHYTR